MREIFFVERKVYPLPFLFGILLNYLLPLLNLPSFLSFMLIAVKCRCSSSAQILLRWVKQSKFFVFLLFCLQVGALSLSLFHQNYYKVGKCNSSCLPKVMILNPDDTESLYFFSLTFLLMPLIALLLFLLLFFYAAILSLVEANDDSVSLCVWVSSQ